MDNIGVVNLHHDGLEDNNCLVAQAFMKNHISVVKLYLITGEALILKPELDREIVGSTMNWSALVERYTQRRVYPPDKALVASFTLEWVKTVCLGGNSNNSVEFRCMSGNDAYEWVELTVCMSGADDQNVLVCTKNIDEQKLVRSIVDLFVYKNYDYLFLIDTQNDSYIRFTGHKGNIPVPPETGSHYTDDM